MIMLIFSLDGDTFTKFAGNPVIPKPEEWHDFRDPKVNIMTYYIIITISLIIDVINVNSVIMIIELILIVI